MGQREKKKEIKRYYITGFEDGGWGYEPRSAGNLQNLKKVRKWILSVEPPEGTQQC